MNKLFRNKTFLILLCAACVLSLVPSVLYLTGAGGAVRGVLQNVLRPAEQLLVSVREKTAQADAYFGDRAALLARIDELEQELASAEGELADAQSLREENEYLSAFLGLATEHPDYSFVYASVASFDSANAATVYTLDKGTDDGIRVNMPVLTALGLFGYVSEVGTHYCRVRGLLDSDTAIGAVAVRTGETGLLGCELSLRQDGLCKLSRLSPETKLAVGDRVETAGGAGIYPGGLLIGEVEELLPDTVNLEVYASVRPAQNPDTVYRVMILTSFDGDGTP